MLLIASSELSDEQVAASTSALTTQLVVATETEEQVSLLPLDLNTTNAVVSSLLDISEESNVAVDEVLCSRLYDLDELVLLGCADFYSVLPCIRKDA